MYDLLFNTLIILKACELFVRDVGLKIIKQQYTQAPPNSCRRMATRLMNTKRDHERMYFKTMPFIIVVQINIQNYN